MRSYHCFRSPLGQLQARRASRWRPPGRGHLRPRLEQFEDRTLLSSYTASSVQDLINDINAANKHGGTNTIVLTAPAASPYVLTAVDNSTDGPTGLPVITNGNTLTIAGNGDTIERSAASGTPAFRLFDVASRASLTLENLTLQQGLAEGSGSSAEGGAIFNQGTLMLSGATVQNSEALGSNGAPGTRNRVNGQPGQDAAGGGVWSNGTLTLQGNTTLANNLAVGGNGGAGSCNNKEGGGTGGIGGVGGGGGLEAAGGTANISSTSLSANTAQGGLGGPAGCGASAGGNGAANGGGLEVIAADVTVSNATVDSNAADSEFGNGGGIADEGTLTVSNSTISGNSATCGGGIDLSNFLTMTVSGTIVSGNTAFRGGGIYAADSTATLSNDTINANTGDGVFIVGSLDFGRTFTFCNDTVENNSGDGIDTEAQASALFIDQFTVDHTIHNGGVNIFPTNDYTLRNC
jgi:hypothetical protein